MNYQSDFRSNRLIIAKPEDYKSVDPPLQKRSSSGKKVFIIRRKTSTSPSSIANQENKQKSKLIINGKNDFQADNKISQQQKQAIFVENSKKSSIKKNNFVSNPQNSRENTYQAMHLSNKQSRYEDKKSLQVSRGQEYEDQLDMIQKDVEFFRFQLEMTKNKKSQLENILFTKQQEVQNTIFGIYSCLNKTFSSHSTTMTVLDQCFPSLLDKRNFKCLIEKLSTKQIQQISLSEVEIDMRFIFKALNLAFETIEKIYQKLTEQEIKINEYQNGLKDYANQIKFVNGENNKIKLQNTKILEKISLLAKENQQGKVTQRRLLQQDASLQASKSLVKSVKNQHILNQIKVQQQKNNILKNAQTQTEQKRIGSAASINKYRPYRFYDTQKNRISPYRHYRHSTDGSIDMTNSLSKIKLQQQLQIQTVKKTKFQPIKDKKLQTGKKPKIADKKKFTPTSSYLNHLIQSETFLKGDETVQTIEFDKKQSQLLKQSSQNRSLLKVRRPVHRSRSHSQQQISTSKQKMNTNKSINNISSRVYSTYSLNPLNKYGDKRLCNEVNSKRVRKITQLSQESESLQEKIKELMEEEKALMEKYKHLQKVKVSRQNKKSRQNKTSLENSRQKMQMTAKN